MTDIRDPQLRVSRHAIRGRTVIIPVGEIDLATRDTLRSCLAECEGDVIVDLFGVSYLDSSGIGVLIAQRNRLTGQGGTLTLRSPRAPVRNVLELVGIDLLGADGSSGASAA